MRLTLLGKSPSWQDADGACSGYLIQEDGTSMVVDCGNGVFGKLRKYCDYTAVDAVVISHIHADHWLDLIPFSYALTYAPRQQPVPVDRWPGTQSPARPKLLAPPGATETFRRVVGAWGNEDLIENAFEIAGKCELLLIEATLPRPERTGVRGHLTPREAGEHGRAAGAKRLVITHISDELDALWARDQAAEAF